MALLKIHKFPDDSLKEPAAPVKNINGNVEGLIDSMVQTMYAAPCSTLIMKIPASVC
jgi:peptide deformylase